MRNEKGEKGARQQKKKVKRERDGIPGVANYILCTENGFYCTRKDQEEAERRRSAESGRKKWWKTVEKQIHVILIIMKRKTFSEYFSALQSQFGRADNNKKKNPEPIQNANSICLPSNGLLIVCFHFDFYFVIHFIPSHMPWHSATNEAKR